MYYFFYKITNKINGKVYYGVHQTSNLLDNYLGSGTAIKNAIKKYGRDNFERTIIKYFENETDMFNYEREFITEEVVNDSNTYNMTIGGFGGFYHINEYSLNSGDNNVMKNPENRIKMSNSWKRNYSNLTEEEKIKREKIALINLKKAQEIWKGSKHKDESRLKISESNMGKRHSEESKKKMSISAKNKPKETIETKQLKSINAKKKYNERLAEGIDWAYNRKGKGKRYNFKHVSGILESNMTCAELYEKYNQSMDLKISCTFGIPKLSSNKTYKGWCCVE